MTSQNLRSGRRTAVTFLGVFGFDLLMAALSWGSPFSFFWAALAAVLAVVLARHLRACARCGRRSLGRFFYVSGAGPRVRVCVDCLTEDEFAAFLTAP